MKYNSPEIRIIITPKRGVERVQVVTPQHNQTEGLALYEKLTKSIDKFTRMVENALQKKE
jgi:hypothetical protein